MFNRRQRGQSLIEYAIMFGAVIALVVGAIVTVGPKLQGVVDDALGQVSSLGNGGGAGGPIPTPEPEDLTVTVTSIYREDPLLWDLIAEDDYDSQWDVQPTLDAVWVGGSTADGELAFEVLIDDTWYVWQLAYGTDSDGNVVLTDEDYVGFYAFLAPTGFVYWRLTAYDGALDYAETPPTTPYYGATRFTPDTVILATSATQVTALAE